MAEHTPGPWKAVECIGGGFVIGAYDPTHEADGVLRLADTVEGRPKGNANLIAAAPALLEACRRAVEYLDWDFEGSLPDLDIPVRSLYDELRDAIAKAEGRL